MSYTRSEAIREVWRTYVWDAPAIKAITDKVIESDLGSQSFHEVTRLRYQQKTNFFAFSVTRSVETLIGNKNRLRYFVRCAYTKYADPAGTAYNDVIDAIEVLQETVITELGAKWQGIVAGYDAQEGPPTVGTVVIGDDTCYTAEFNYEALICTA